VALKVLNKEFRHHPEALKSLQQEAKKAQSLAHPNAVTVHDFDRDRAAIYMTMEYLPGRSLDGIVRARDFKGLPRPEAFGILRDVAAAEKVAWYTGVLNEANRLVAAEQAARVVAQEAAAQRAKKTVPAMRSAGEALARGVDRVRAAVQSGLSAAAPSSIRCLRCKHVTPGRFRIGSELARLSAATSGSKNASGFAIPIIPSHQFSWPMIR